MDFHSLPKTHLHVHLEGSVRIETIFALYQMYGKGKEDYIDLNDFRQKVQMGREFHSFSSDFLSKFGILFGPWVNQNALIRITKELIDDNYDEGVRYLEIRYCPQSLFMRTGINYGASVEAIIEAIRIGRDCHPDMCIGLIVSFDQRKGAQEADKLWHEVKKYSEFICAFDIASDPSVIPLSEYRDVCSSIHNAGLGLTIHAGEMEGPESVRDAIESLEADRIGHGVRAIEDPSVIELILRKEVLLEISISSNVCTKAVPSIEKHPIKDLFLAGVPISLNTDDSTIFCTDLTNEYQIANERFGFGEEDFRKMNQDALLFGFLGENEKRKVTKFFK